MSKIVAFIQVQGQPGVIETEISPTATVGEIHDALEAKGIKIEAETFVFVDDSEEHLPRERYHAVHGCKRGCRIHISRSRRIKVAVNFTHRTAEREFPPGARVRAVKEWAVRKFEMSPQDAAEHVLQLCGSTERPATDTPLVQLTRGHDCSVCFDLVPEKRVEG